MIRTTTRRPGEVPSIVVSTLAWLLASGIAPLAAQSGAYDPLRIEATAAVHTVDLTAHDSHRRRDLPLRVYLPRSTTPAAVVLFSHGLGGSREGSPFMGQHWAARGYVAVFVQHPGSDESVWKDIPARERMRAMRRAANGQNLVLRVEDVSAVLNQLAAWAKEPGHALYGRLDLGRVGMSGHSFGAITTQAVSGQSLPLVGTRYVDSRIKAAVAFSPSLPQRADAFAAVRIPWMLMTGTRDEVAIGNASAKSRQEVFPKLPPGGKYELVLWNAEHSVFTEGALPFDKHERNPNHHRVILAVSTAFWDAYVNHDAAAKAWLDGAGPRSVMEPRDTWRLK